MNNALGPHSTEVSHLVVHAATALTRATASGDSRAVEIALAVKSDALVSFSSVGASGEAVEHGVSPAVGGRRQPKNRPRAELPALPARHITPPPPPDNHTRLMV